MNLGIAGAVAIVLGLGAVFAWLLRRSLLHRIGEIGRDAAAIVERDLSRRLPDELFDLAPDAIVLTEMNPSRIVRVNREFTRMFGYTAEEAVGRSLRTLIAPGELEADYAANAAAIAAGERVDRALLRQRKDGTRLHVQFTSAAVKTDDGKGAAYLIYRDITQRKQAEDALRESEKRYALAMRASGEGHWDWKIESDEFYASPRYLEIGGFPPDIKFSRRADIVDRIAFHPDDRAKYQAAVAAHFAGETPRLDIVIRIVPHGEIRWLHVIGMCSRDGGGKPVRWAGSVNDITERKLAADALRASEARFRSLTELSSDWYWEQDESLRFTYLSNQALSLTGYSGESSHGKTRWEISNHTPLSCSWPEHQALLAARQPFRDLETRRVGPDGTVRYLSISGAPIFDELGRFKGYRGIGRNITERKRIEEALRLSEERYALAMEAAGDGHTDWNLQTGEHYISPRLLQICGHAPGSSFRDRADWVRRFPFHPEDRPKWERAVAAHFAGSEPHFKMELRIVVRGEVRWTAFHFLSTRDAAGTPIRWTGSIGDITEQKRAEEALRTSEERYSLAVEASEEGHFDVKYETKESFYSDRLLELFGIAAGTRFANRAEAVKQMRFYGNDAQIYADAISGVETRGGPDRYEFEFRIVLPSGDIRWLRTRGKVTRDAEGNIRRRTGVAADVTEAKLAEQELRESQERYALAVAGSDDGVWDVDFVARRVFVSARARELAGLPPGPEMLPMEEFFAGLPLHPDDVPRRIAAMQAHLAGRAPAYEGEFRLRQPDGGYRWRRIHGLCVRDANGSPQRMAGSISDVDARRRAVDTLRESEGRFRRMTELSADTYWEQDENFRYTRTGEGTDIAGYATDVNQGKTRWELSGEATPLSGSWLEHQAVLAAHQAFRDFEYRRLRPDGTIGYYSASGAPMFDAEGRFRGYQGVARDITERKRVEEALRQSEERYALAVAGSNEGIFDWDLVSDRVYVSHRAQELFGLPRGELWRPRRDWRHIVTFHPDDAPRLHDGIKRHIEGGTPTYDEEFRIVLPGGGVRWFRQRGIALRDDAGKAYRVVGSIGDVTEKHKAEEELSRLERQLRLAQRLEAMGTLAGGIAHDFNNILGAILGYGEMALRDAPKGTRLARDLDSIVVAGERGRALVDRVLAFSRSGVGERVPVHVEKVVREALDLISAQLPPNVTLHAKLHSGRAALLGDATQVHQVLMNLATNAIQAMPAGGTLRVSLSAARLEASRTPTLGIMPAGDYLILEVADTGTGIAPEILDRIFDPFFTTKDVGTGTGLGLSLVHGIVTELGGAIDVASAPGAGSTFTVFLPRAGDASDSSQEEPPQLPRGDGQRVLVVDDEEPLVRLATRTLQELGYAPTGFTSSTAALAAFRADPQGFDALITDERMPGMSGSSLIREVRGIRGGIPIVLMSGYVGGAVASNAREAGAEEVLQKPLSARDLAASLARVLHP